MINLLSLLLINLLQLLCFILEYLRLHLQVLVLWRCCLFLFLQLLVLAFTLLKLLHEVDFIELLGFNGHELVIFGGYELLLCLHLPHLFISFILQTIDFDISLGHLFDMLGLQGFDLILQCLFITLDCFQILLEEFDFWWHFVEHGLLVINWRLIDLNQSLQLNNLVIQILLLLLHTFFVLPHYFYEFNIFIAFLFECGYFFFQNYDVCSLRVIFLIIVLFLGI